MADTTPYETFTRARMPWMRTLANSTILLSDDAGRELCALTPAAAEDLAAALQRQAEYIRAGFVPAAPPPALVTPSRTDRQLPASATQAKGGLSAVAPDETKQPDSVTDNKGTTHG